MTKQFTAVALLQLAEKGLIGLDDPLGSLLPLNNELMTNASVRDLLAHTSGIRGDLERFMLADSRSGGAISREAVLALVTDDLFDAQPGAVWRYSNFGYHLLGIAIEEITGESYPDYLANHVLPAVRLSSTWYGADTVPQGLLAQGYTDRNGEFASVDIPTSIQTFSSGGLFSNVLDLQRWTAAFHQGRLVRAESYQLMTTPTLLSSGQQTSYGLGFFLGRCGEYREIGHDGTSGGYSVQSAYYPDAELSVVVLMNCEKHEAERLEKTISRHILGVKETVAEDLPISKTELAKYAGIYLHNGIEVPVEVRGSVLTIATPSRRVCQLLYRGHDVFAQDDDPAMTFEFAVHGSQADSVEVARGGKTIAIARRLH
jgi:CubicO group peptidase (beta-lactamase class C family)